MNLAVQSIMLGLDSATKISVGYLLARLGIQVDSRLTIEEEDTEQLKNLESKLQGLEEVIRGMTTQAEQNVKKSLHFSRLDSREFYDEFVPSGNVNSKDLRTESAKTIHAQVTLNNGRTVSFTSIEGMQILCGFLTKQGEGL